MKLKRLLPTYPVILNLLSQSLLVCLLFDFFVVIPWILVYRMEDWRFVGTLLPWFYSLFLLIYFFITSEEEEYIYKLHSKYNFFLSWVYHYNYLLLMVNTIKYKFVISQFTFSLQPLSQRLSNPEYGNQHISWPLKHVLAFVKISTYNRFHSNLVHKDKFDVCVA